jgi:hypothetical protein
MSEKISESEELSEEEKIQQLKEVLEKIQALEVTKKEQKRRRRLADIEAANVASRLIAEINKSKMSHEEKIAEIQELLQRSRAMESSREERRSRNLVELKAAETIRKMLREIAESEELSDKERAMEFERTLQEARKLKLASMERMIGIEKFKLDLHLFLKKEGFLPEGKAEFILRSNECLIDGKKLPAEIHTRILELSEQSLGKKFDSNTKIVLQLNQEKDR